MPKRSLPWGRLITLKNSPFYYWHYYDQDAKQNRMESTKQREENAAYRVAEKRAVEYLAQRTEDTERERVGPTIAQAIEGFLEVKAEDVLQGTCSLRHYNSMNVYFNNSVLPFFGASKPVASIESKDVYAFNEWLRGKRGLSAESTNKVITYLSGVFKFSANKGYISAIPYMQRARKGQEVAHGYELSKYQYTRLLFAACRMGRNVLLLVSLGLHCGLRAGEAVRVRWEDIDWKKKQIRMTVQKNKSVRPAYLLRAESVLDAVPMEERKGCIYQYLDPQDRRYRPVKEFEKTWATLRKAAGLDGIVKPDGAQLGFHDLRHTFCSQYIRRLGPHRAMTLSRHKDMRALFKYLHISEEEDLWKRLEETEEP